MVAERAEWPPELRKQFEAVLSTENIEEFMERGAWFERATKWLEWLRKTINPKRVGELWECAELLWNEGYEKEGTRLAEFGNALVLVILSLSEPKED